MTQNRRNPASRRLFSEDRSNASSPPFNPEQHVPNQLNRRQFLRNVGFVSSAVIARDLWESAFAGAASPVEAGDGPYGPLGDPDVNGIQLPAGFASRVVARTGDLVPGTEHVWHQSPDGGVCFAAMDGGWVYVSNSEVSGGGGGVGV